MNPRQPYLKLRKAVGLAPLPEEMLGVRGPDPFDGRDRMKSPADGRRTSFGPFEHHRLHVCNQGRTNRCGGFTGAGLLYLRHLRTGMSPVHYSANEVYWHARPDRREKDSGVYLRDLMRALKKFGSAAEQYWPNHADLFRRPEAIRDAPALNIESYERLDHDPENWWQVLSVENLPIAIGFKVYRNAAKEANRTGTWPVPDDKDTPDGHHAVLVGQYRPDKRYGHVVKIWNWWGQTRIPGGCQWMPVQYITERLVMDAWSEGLETFAGT